MVKRALIFLAGSFDGLPSGFVFQSDDLLIAADGGYEHLKAWGKEPDILVGDFDSLPEGQVKKAQKAGIKIEEWPQDKDYTDGEIALNIAEKEGARKILFLGAWGGNRLDHTLGNLFLLRLANQKNLQGLIYSGGYFVRILNPGTYKIWGNKNGFVSLIPLSLKVEEINTQGLIYSLTDSFLAAGYSKGLSNRFKESEAQISFKKGELLLVWQGIYNLCLWNEERF